MLRAYTVASDWRPAAHLGARTRGVLQRLWQAALL